MVYQTANILILWDCGKSVFAVSLLPEKLIKMTEKTVLSIIAGILASTLIAFSQRDNHVLTGKVTDENYKELVGATVYVEELGVGDDTDTSGNFRIDHIPDGRHRVVVRYMGYRSLTQEIEFKPGKQIRQENFNLQPDDRMLVEVEVFGVRRERPEKMEALTRIPLRL